MRMNRHARSRSTLHRLTRAVYGIGWNDGGAGGGGAGETKPEEKKDDAKKDDKSAADSITLTKAERDQLIADAKAEAKRDADAKAAKAKADADEEEAKKKGEWEKLANDEKAKREAAESKLAGAERERKVEKALNRAAAGHEGYPLTVFEEYVLPKVLGSIEADASDSDIEKAVTAAAKKYVDDNPRQAKGSAGAPAGPSRQAGRAAAARNGRQKQEPQFTGAAARW